MTDDDPGLLFDWDTSVLQDFVRIANLNHGEEDNNGDEVSAVDAVELAGQENRGEMDAAGGAPVGLRNHRRRLPPIPAWITSNAGAMTAATLTNDIITFCAATGGGRAGRVLIAPNTQAQFTKVVVKLSKIEGNEFVQACAAQLRNGQVLATTYIISKTKVCRAQPLNLDLDDGLRQLFL